jgi:hypothetical protein
MDIDTSRPAEAILDPAGTGPGRRPLLRTSLLLDVAVSAGSGLLTLVTAAWWPQWFGVPTGWAVGLGGFMLIWALGCALAAARSPVPPVVRLVAVLNLGYVLASVLAGVDRLWPLTGTGEAVLVLQTVGVAGIAAVQLIAARRP